MTTICMHLHVFAMIYVEKHSYSSYDKVKKQTKHKCDKVQTQRNVEIFTQAALCSSQQTYGCHSLFTTQVVWQYRDDEGCMCVLV